MAEAVKEKNGGAVPASNRVPIVGRLPKRYVLGTAYFVAASVIALVLLYRNAGADPETVMLKKACSCTLLVLITVLFTVWYDKLMVLPVELWSSRRLIRRLAVNDFKKRYAGSYMGVIWAFVQPVVTVIMYWIVFDLVFNTRQQMVAGGMDIPYVLFLTTGLAPWFFFSEALTSGTNSLIEYNYLVKKVVFKISILPLIKVIAALFVHLVFIVVMLIVALCYGVYPSVYLIQLPYYTACAFVLVLSLSYTTCAVQVFFRDLAHLISILLQLFMWATPVLWDVNMVPMEYRWIVKLNPVVYIVNGYRMSLYGGEWFFDHFFTSTYFWLVTAALFVFGSLVFKRTKVHFADVL